LDANFLKKFDLKLYLTGKCRSNLNVTDWASHQPIPQITRKALRGTPAKGWILHMDI
jgi:hypothetical protein